MVEGRATTAPPPCRPPTGNTRPNYIGEATPQKAEKANDWLKHIDTLTKLYDDLKEEVKKTPKTDPLRR